MTQIRKRKKPTTKSSSSVAMGKLKVPQDVLALGRQLVEQLHLEPSVDTLGRWMAHHLAELISAVEKAKSASERASATNQAVETILKIWSHRATSNHINPLADLAPVLNILRSLGERSFPLVVIEGVKRNDAARQLYDLLRRITICLVCLELSDFDSMRKGLGRASRVAKYLSKTERELLAHLSQWIDLASFELKERRPTPGDSKAKTQSANFVAITRELIEEASSLLDEIKKEL